MIGQRLLHYEITEKLGEGGMGVVYKARDSHLDRFVAIKVLPPERVADPSRKARFTQEAKASSALNHPNIVTIYDISSDNGIDFITMEYVDGKTLDQIIPRNGLRLNEALKLAIQIADALARAHSSGIVHRDLKPANIMVDTHGQVKVLDFGLAKLTETSPDDLTRTMKTSEGQVLGTAAYMSPEQAEGRPVDARSDIFSFGSVLYEMVSGRRAFQGDSAISTLTAVLRQDPPRLSDEIPHDLQQLIGRCLRKDCARRMAHIDDVRLALQDLKEESDSGHAGGPPSAPRRSVLRLLWPIASVLLLASVFAGVWLVRREQQPALTVKPLVNYPGNEQFPSFSPDGRQLAFSWDGEHRDSIDVWGRGNVFITMLGSPGQTRLTNTDDGGVPAWSPDGTTVLLQRWREGRIIFSTTPALPGPEKIVREMSPAESAPGAYPPLAAWFPDSRHIVFFDGQMQDLHTGALRRLWSPAPGTARASDNSIAVSPDGRTIAFSRFTSMGRSEIHTLHLNSKREPEGEPRPITSLSLLAHNPVFTPDGKEILFVLRRGFFGGGSIYRLPLSGAGAPALLPVGQDVAFGLATSSRPGRWAFVQQHADSNIYRLPLNAQGEPEGEPVLLITSSRLDYCPSYSPDGSEIAFISDRLGQMGIWKCRADGSDPTELFSSPDGFADWPVWSPDGKWIVFSFAGKSRREIWQVAARGGAPVRITDQAESHLPSYSNDGKWIYFGSTRSGAFQIWKRPAEGGAPVQLTRRGGLGGFESADRKWFVYRSAFRSPSSIMRVPANGGEETVLVPLAYNHTVAVVPAGVHYLSLTGQTGEYLLQFKDWNSPKERTVARLGRRIGQGMSVSPDRRSLLFVKQEGSGRDIMLVENFK
jgi:serine/threonine protein kinase